MAIGENKTVVWKIVLTGAILFFIGLILTFFLDEKYHFVYVIIGYIGFFIGVIGFLLHAKNMFSSNADHPKKTKQPWE